MGLYIDGLDMPRNEYMRIHIDFDGEVWVFRGSGWKSLGIKATNLDLVRCEECKWCDDKGKERALICTNPYIDMDIHPLDFCSYGKRRTDETIESITFKKMVKAVEEEMREVRNFVKRKNDGAVCSYGVSANANQHTQRVEGVGEREPEDFNPYQGDRDRDENGDIY